MAIALIAASGEYPAKGPTPAIDTTGADLLILASANYDRTASPTDSRGNAWLPLTQQVNGMHRGQLWYCLAPASVGPAHTVITPNGGSGGYGSLQFAAFSGVGGLDREDGGIWPSGEPATFPATTPGVAGSLIVAGGSIANSTSATAGGGLTLAGATGYAAGGRMGVVLAYAIQAGGPAPIGGEIDAVSGSALGRAVFYPAAGGSPGRLLCFEAGSAGLVL